MRNKTLLLVLVLALASVLAACGGAAAAQGLPIAAQSSPSVAPGSPVAQGSPAAQQEGDQSTPRTLTVNGSGQAFLTPDIAYINIGVHTEGEDATAAVSKNNTQTQKVIDTLKAMNIAAKDIQTTNFSIFPQQQFDQEGKPTGKILYQVDNSVLVTVRDIDMVGEILDAAVKAGANSINGIQFDVENQAEALSAARQEAVQNAQAQAQELAQAAGVQLGDIQSISSYNSVPPQPLVYGRGAAAPAMDQAGKVPVSSGQMTLTVEVSLVYEIQ